MGLFNGISAAEKPKFNEGELRINHFKIWNLIFHIELLMHTRYLMPLLPTIQESLIYLIKLLL